MNEEFRTEAGLASLDQLTREGFIKKVTLEGSILGGGISRLIFLLWNMNNNTFIGRLSINIYNLCLNIAQC